MKMYPKFKENCGVVGAVFMTLESDYNSNLNV
jgi:hypothetical protein